MNKTRFIAFTGVCTALVAVFTFIHFVIFPATNGYVNLGDAAIFVTGIFFGPIPALISGGIGSAITDLFLGYTLWAPFTLVIKGMEGFIMGILVKVLCKVFPKKLHILAYVIAMILAGIEMIAGYFFATWILYGLAAAVISLGEGGIQVSASIIIALILLSVTKSIIFAIRKKE